MQEIGRSNGFWGARPDWNVIFLLCILAKGRAFWQTKMLFMRIGNILRSMCLSALVFVCWPVAAHALGSGDGVAIQYYFSGASTLASNADFQEAKAIFTAPPAKGFRNFVLDRLTGVYWKALQFDPNIDATNLLRPILDDLLLAESVGSFGGHDTNRMDFVLAAKLDAKAAGSWEKNLETALHGKGETWTEEGFSGERWNRAGKGSLWILHARDWTLVGGGEDLPSVRSGYLRSIKKDNRPITPTKDNWVSASVDWPLLANWVPGLSHSPVKLARTVAEVTASKERIHATIHVTYPQAVAWKGDPWRIPKGLVGGPLSSFTASRDLEPYLNGSDAMSHFSSDPLGSQLYCWALRSMVLESYAAWPVTDASNVVKKLGAEAPPALNPLLEARQHTHLSWVPSKNQLAWDRMAITAPILEAVHDTNGDFLLAKIFPMQPEVVPVSPQLFSQFEGHEDLIYYDWELTRLRLLQWRLLSELLPVFPPSPYQESPLVPKAAPNAKPRGPAKTPPLSLVATEAWLGSLVLPPGNTVTEITRTSPTELTVTRNSQFLFTGLEWVLLSHWLADAPVGPIDMSLLPQAKMSALPGARH